MSSYPTSSAPDPKMAPLGNLVRLLPLHINELPAHPALESLISSASDHTQPAGSSLSQPAKVQPSERPNLIDFIEEVLDQAILFVDDTLPATFKEGGLEKSAPAISKVRQLSRNISRTEVEAVPWINSGMYTPKDMLAYFEFRDCVSGADFSISPQHLFYYSPFHRRGQVNSDIHLVIPRNWSNGRKPAEAWFARRSRHADHSGEGTAGFSEFDDGLRRDHSMREQ